MARHRSRVGSVLTASMIVGVAAVGLCAGLLALLITVVSRRNGCGQASVSGTAAVVLGPPGSGQRVGASEYGGPGDPSSGATGARGDDLLAHPDSYAELGGLTWQTATAMGGLPYMTPLRITWADHSAIAYKRDFGLGGGPVDGLPRAIDLWWQLAGRLGIPYERGLWSGAVKLERAPDAGAGELLAGAPGQGTPVARAGGAAGSTDPASGTADPAVLAAGADPAGPAGLAAGADPAACTPDAATGVPLTAGERATLLPNGLAAAPRDAPLAVKEMIAAGNQIVGKPYVYGAAHGLPLSEVAPAYDCSSSVEHLLYAAGMLPVTYAAASGQLESFGRVGTGHWVTVYASADHVFMYVAGLRWDTHGAAGAGDGSAGIGWHPLVRSAAGFVARHPAGL